MNIKNLHTSFCQHQMAIKNFRPTTISGYENSIRVFLNVFPNIKDIEQVSFLEVQEFFYWGRNKRNWKPITFITYHKQLNVFFKWAVKNEFIKDNPFEKIEKPKLEKKLPTRLTKDQSLILMETAFNISKSHIFLRYRNKSIFATFLYCGLRKKELLNLTLSDVDLTNMVINIRQGKGNKDRVVPISNQLKYILLDYLQERDKLNKPCSAFWVSLNSDRPYTDSGLKRLVDNLKKETGIKFYCHMLRHTFATLMIEGGVDIYSLSKMLGHNDIKTTTIYLSASVEHLREQMTKHPLNLI